ncbi:hypothetical protein EIP91_007243 [Steccherinum ochraceum]|uniref:Uncharacterized protein n=1 Tax=Steccherinum ochraceum TaxID=92696 RepID=A0A4R0RA56_9APHY|nr:hypothetical protein EIP91_007243 [Steccherinum ochraceum]
MDSTPTQTLRALPPPTSNNLDAHSRARLVRTTRKLGAILGTTPHLLELDLDAALPATTLTYRPDTPAPQASTRRSRPRPDPLVLRLNAIPVAPSDPRLPLSPLPSSPRTAFAEDDLPSTPKLPSMQEMRRRKMSKLNRTLGENVPPELVFSGYTPYPVNDAPTTPRARTHKARRGTVSVDERPCHHHSRRPAMELRREILSEEEDGDRPSSQIWVTGTRGWRGEWNRKDIRDVQSGLRNLKGR